MIFYNYYFHTKPNKEKDLAIMGSPENRGFRSGEDEAKHALGEYSTGILVGLAEAAERAATFDTDLDTGSRKPLENPLPLETFDGIAVNKKVYYVGIRDLGEAIRNTLPGGLPNVIGLTLERDAESDPNLPEIVLVRIGKTPNSPDGYHFTAQEIQIMDGKPALSPAIETPLTEEQLHASAVKNEGFRLASEESRGGRGLGIPGYTITGVSAFAMVASDQSR